MFRRQFTVRAAAALLGLGLAGTAMAESAAEKRADINKMRKETLSSLYKLHPEAQSTIKKAAGYAVFSNVGINLVLISAAGGSGIAHNNKTGQDTYMKMVSGGFGFGLGVKDFRGVFVFSSADKLDTFINSVWDASAQVDAAAKSGKKGDAVAGALTVAPGVTLYQITESGLALQATIQGTKYFKDDELNAR